MAFVLGGLATSAALYSARCAIESRADDSSVSSQSSSSSESLLGSVIARKSDGNFYQVIYSNDGSSGLYEYHISFDAYFCDIGNPLGLADVTLSALTIQALDSNQYPLDLMFDRAPVVLGNGWVKAHFEKVVTSSASSSVDGWLTRYDGVTGFNMQSQSYQDGVSDALQYNYSFVGPNVYSDSWFVDTVLSQGSNLYSVSPYAPNHVGGGSIVTNIATWLTAGLEQMGNGIGSGVSSFVQSLAIDNGSLSPYFIMVVAFGGIALACALTRKITQWTENLGA